MVRACFFFFCFAVRTDVCVGFIGVGTEFQRRINAADDVPRNLWLVVVLKLV